MWFSFSSSVSQSVKLWYIWIRAARHDSANDSVFLEEKIFAKRRIWWISKQEILRFSDVILINGIEEDKARIRLSFDSFLCNKKKYRKLEPSIVKKFYNSIIFMHKIWIYESLKTSIPSFKKLKILNLIYFLEKVNQKR